MKSFENTFETPKVCLHARYDWKITFLDWKQKNFENFFENFFLKKLRKRRIVPENEKRGPFGIH